MLLTDIAFLYVFLPVFMGLYALSPGRARPWLISAANIFMLISNGRDCIILFLISFIPVYFDAIYLYNTRKETKEAFFRKKAFIADIALNLLLLFLSTAKAASDIPDGTFNALRLYGSAVIPLHAISYLADVYRGDCPAQTNVSSLAAYIAFFPSLGFGPVMKYKNHAASFASPKLSVEKTAAGIKYFVFGLAEYKLIAEPLYSVRRVILASDINKFSAASIWLSVIVFYAAFAAGVMGMLQMGQGVTLMLGFYKKPPFVRRFLRDSVKEQLYTFNIPLASWFYDYLYKPLKKIKTNSAEAVGITVFLGSAWYSLSPLWLLSSLLFAGISALEVSLSSRIKKLPAAVKRTAARLVMVCFAIAAAGKLCSGMGIKRTFLQLLSAPLSENDPFGLIIDTSLPLMIAAFIAVGSLIPEFMRKINLMWLKAVMPIIELLLLMLSTAYMLFG